MPQPPTTYMLLILPTPGSDDDAWDDYINTALGGVNGIDAHDHTTNRGKQVPSAGVNIDADLSMNAHRLTTITGLAFQALGSALTVGAREIFSFNGDLYFRNAAGANVRITNGSTLDVTSVGGIAGDYAAIGAEVAYVDASDTYTMKQQIDAAVRQYARVACGSLDLFEYKAAGASPVPVQRVRLQSPAALAASYALTMPAALPASTQLVQMSSAGVLTASNVLATNENVTVSGTGAYKHGSITVTIPIGPPAVSPASGQWNDRLITISGSGSGASNLLIPISLPVGKRILNYRVRVTDSVTGPTTVQARMRLQNSGASFTAVPSSTSNASNGGGTEQTLTCAAVNVTFAASTEYFVEVFNATGSANCAVKRLEVDYDHP